MKLILIQELPGLGTAGDVVEVKDGYARNYLVPRGYATVWSKGGEKQVSSIRAGRKARAVESLDGARQVKADLEGTKVKLSARAGEAGRLFGAVTTSDIASAINAAGGPSVDKRRIEVRSPIKTVGTHTITVRLHPEVAADVSLDVVAG